MKYFFGLVFILFTQFSFAQADPVKWTFEAQKIDDKQVKLVFTAHMDGDWAVYSQFLGDEGPFPTTFVLKNDKNEENPIKFDEPKGITEFDKLFEMDIKKFKKEVVFEKIVDKKSLAESIKGYVTFMTCDNSRCLPPKDIDFNIAIP